MRDNELFEEEMEIVYCIAMNDFQSACDEPCENCELFPKEIEDEIF